MARYESDREDLLAEAVALVRRVELHVDDETEPVVAGVRENKWLSIYFGSEPVYHFDEAGRLRRAFDGGCLYRTQGTTLARLNRSRNDTKTILNRYDLDETELSEFLNTMADRLRRLQNALQNGRTQILRSVPAASDFQPELLEYLDGILQSAPRLAPAIPGKR